jgi:hypothetical protein
VAYGGALLCYAGRTPDPQRFSSEIGFCR